MSLGAAWGLVFLLQTPSPLESETETASRSISAEQRAEEQAREEALFGAPDGPTPPDPSSSPGTPKPSEAASSTQTSEGLAPGSGEPAASIQAREAAMFGPSAPDGGTLDRNRGLDRGSARLLDRLTSKLEARDDALSLGGQLLLQTQLSFLEDAPVEQTPVRAPTFLDLYLDARPSDRIRLFAQGRVQTDFTQSDGSAGTDGGAFAFQGLAGFVGGQTQVLLDQLWLKFDVARTLYVTAGQQRVRWGSGRVFNPTDFLNRQRVNPVAILDQRLGIGLLKLHLPLERLGWNFYAVADLDDANRVDRVGGLLRGEFLFEQAEVALTVASQADQGERLGLDVSAGIWLLELRAEVAATTGSTEPFFQGEFDLGNLQFPTAVDRSEQWLVEAMGGFDLTLKLNDDNDQLILGAEYYYNQGGYSDSDLLPFFGVSTAFSGAAGTLGALAGAADAVLPPATSAQVQDAVASLEAASQFALNPFRYGRHYAAVFATLLGPGNWDDTTFLLTGITNLSDRSGLLRFDLSQQILTFLSLRVFTQVYLGQDGGLFKLSVPPLVQPGDPLEPVVGAAQGLAPGLAGLLTQGVPPPLLDLGFAFTLSF